MQNVEDRKQNNTHTHSTKTEKPVNTNTSIMHCAFIISVTLEFIAVESSDNRI